MEETKKEETKNEPVSVDEMLLGLVKTYGHNFNVSLDVIIKENGRMVVSPVESHLIFTDDEGV